MQSNTIILTIAAIVVVIFVGLFIRSSGPGAVVSNTTTPTATAGVLKVAEPHYDFGAVSMAKGKVTRAYSVTNASTSTVTIKKLYTSCMCTEAKLAIDTQSFGPFGMPGHGAVPTIAAILAPGATAVVEATFDPAAHGPAGVGPISRSIYLEGNGTRIAELTFKAMVTP